MAKSPQNINKNSKIQIQLKSKKKLLLEVPRLLDGTQQYKINNFFHLGQEYSELVKWQGLQLEAKTSEQFNADNKADILSKEVGYEVSPIAIKEESYSWGKVSSFCTPSSGGTCAFLLLPKNEKSIIILRYSSSAHLVFNFSSVILDEQ